MTPNPAPPETFDALSDLLLRWRDRRDQGTPCTPEELCCDCPQLLDDLRRQIEAIESMERRLLPKGNETLRLGDAPSASGGRPGTVAGYELLDELGRGGMGVVYKARQISLNRLVALKMILHGSHASPEQISRFRAEAEALARLHHPGVVQVYEAGEQIGIPFLSLEYVEGGSLDRHIAGKPMPPLDAARLVQSLARAIHAAHSAGIVHRDLKPANVLLAACGFAEDAKPKATIAKITDFGLAKLLDGEVNTQSGSVLGTPCYMSPEQAEGRIKDIGPAVDIYALGAILYECLTGQPPFRGETAMETLRKVTTQQPLSLSGLRPGIPRDLETICLKCLRKEQAGRYATAEELADDLQRFLDGKPIRARNVGYFERCVKWIRRRPEIALMVSLVLVSIALVFIFWPRPEPPTPPSVRAGEARAILVKYCFTCHGQDTQKLAGKLSVLDRERLLNSKRRVVVPGDVKASRLIVRIEDNSMPPEEAEGYPRLSSDELKTLKEWVAEGAPAFAEAEPQDFVPPPPPSALAIKAREVFQRRCYECHKTGKAEQGIKILNHDLLVVKRKVVVPGSLEQSRLWHMLVSEDDDERMPQPPQDPLSKSDLEAVRRWIEGGAPPFPLTDKR
jgi:serine/threonine protein kinase